MTVLLFPPSNQGYIVSLGYPAVRVSLISSNLRAWSYCPHPDTAMMREQAKGISLTICAVFLSSVFLECISIKRPTLSFFQDVGLYIKSPVETLPE